MTAPARSRSGILGHPRKAFKRTELKKPGGRTSPVPPPPLPLPPKRYGGGCEGGTEGVAALPRDCIWPLRVAGIGRLRALSRHGQLSVISPMPPASL
jgi:hypothetical protein